MSRPKELNFFVAELNWPLGPDWYASHFDRRRRAVRGESSPHYTEPAALRRRRRAHALGARRSRAWSTWSATRSTACSRTTCTTSAAATRTGRWPRRSSDPGVRLRRPQPLRVPARALSRGVRRRADRGRHPRGAEERPRRARCGASSSFLGVDPTSPREQFEREWETGTAKSGGRFRIMDRAVRLPGLRALDRNFDRLPESLRWLVERIVHDPGAGEVAKPELPPELRDWLRDLFRDDVERLEELAGPQLRLAGDALARYAGGIRREASRRSTCPLTSTHARFSLGRRAGRGRRG